MKDYKAMIKGYLEFNNCGEFTITENGTEYMVRFDSHNKTLDTEYPDKEALRIWLFELEEEEEETTKFVEGAEYRLYCKDGAIAKRTATFVKWYNKKEGLFKIGATVRPIQIAVSEDGREYTKRDGWWMGGRDMFDKYQNIVATDRIK